MTEKKEEKEEEETELPQGPGRVCRASHYHKGSPASRSVRERVSSASTRQGGGLRKTGFAEAELCVFTPRGGGSGGVERKSGDQFELTRVNRVRIERK